MAVRIRRNGRIFCAALSKPKKGDTYLDDHIHYILAVEARVLVTTSSKHHNRTGGEWWWLGKMPAKMTNL